MALQIHDLAFRYGAAPVLQGLDTQALPRGVYKNGRKLLATVNVNF